MIPLDLSVLAENYTLLALIDKDPTSRAIRKRFKNNCQELGIPVHQTQRYALENYFPLDVLRTVFENQIDDEVQEINPNQKLEEQIGINVKKNNRKIAQKMTLSDIEGTDLAKFFEKVEELCQA
jgi:ACT domain-containing protein